MHMQVPGRQKKSAHVEAPGLHERQLIWQAPHTLQVSVCVYAQRTATNLEVISLWSSAQYVSRFLRIPSAQGIARQGSDTALEC